MNNEELKHQAKCVNGKGSPNPPAVQRVVGRGKGRGMSRHCPKEDTPKNDEQTRADPRSGPSSSSAHPTDLGQFCDETQENPKGGNGPSILSYSGSVKSSSHQMNGTGSGIKPQRDDGVGSAPPTTNPAVLLNRVSRGRGRGISQNRPNEDTLVIRDEARGDSLREHEPCIKNPTDIGQFSDAAEQNSNGIVAGRELMGSGNSPRDSIKDIESGITTLSTTDEDLSTYPNLQSLNISVPKTVVTKKGTSGDKVLLSCNYFKLVASNDFALYLYRVDFLPEEDVTAVRKRLLRVHANLFGEGYLFDGSVLYLSRKLPQQVTEIVSVRESDKELIKITLREVKDSVIGYCHRIQLFNILMRKCLECLNLQMVGRYYFDSSSRISVKEYNLDVWPGYITSIRQHENNVLMCAEVIHKVMRRDTALHLLSECRSRSCEPKEVFLCSILGSIVLTSYNNKTYRIDDVDFDHTPKSTFQSRSGEAQTYIQYYQNRYAIRIRDETQPMLVSKAKPREIRAGMSPLIYLVPELCRLTGLTDKMRSNFNLMRALADSTRLSPNVRIDRLLALNSKFSGTPEIAKELSHWNMELSPLLETLEGRILPSESIEHGAKKLSQAGTDADWTKQMRYAPMYQMAVNFTRWVIICPNELSGDITNLMGALCKSGTSMEFRLPKPAVIYIDNDRPGTYVRTLESVIGERNPEFIMIIVPNNKIDRYRAIKRKCCIDRPVPSQVVLSKVMSSKNIQSIASKIVIQMNCKLGGTPWTVSVPIKNLMVVGFDVCHDSSDKNRSFGALVASLDKNFGRYFSAVSHHACGQELSDDLAINVIRAAEKFLQFNGALPASIVVYRDGVGEGQIPYVQQHEVEVLKKELFRLYRGTPPKFGFIIVTKRINTRIFCNNSNPLPGTIVDDCITSPDKYDFFLVSQSVKQGTVSPTSYNIIEDTTGLNPDRMQRLAYKMTHLYFNWSGTIRVPAPCQYAHKLAFMAGQFLNSSPSPELETSLYFL